MSYSHKNGHRHVTCLVGYGIACSTKSKKCKKDLTVRKSHCIIIVTRNNSILHNVKKEKVKNMKTNTKTNKDQLSNYARENDKLAFQDLLSTYASESKDTTTKTYDKALTDLATAIAYSVTNKCINTSYNSTLVSIRQDIARDTHTLNTTMYSNTHATRLTHNDDGDMIQTVIDRSYKSATDKLIDQTLGDGLDLVHTAIIAIMDETKKQKERGDQVDLEKPYTVRRLKQKVWIKKEDSVHGWETVETSPILEVYRAVRRAIRTSRAAATDPQNGYSYLADVISDPDGDGIDTIYRRLPKYADLGGYATDYNGACTLYSADQDTVDKYDDMIAKLNLTKKQAQIVKLSEAGYGSAAIGTYLGIKPQSVDTTLDRIAKKAVEVFDLPSYFLDKIDKKAAPTSKLTDDDKKTIKQMFKDGYTMSYIAIHFNVSKMTVSRVIKGRNDRKK